MNHQNKTLKISSFSSSKIIRTSSLVFIAAAFIVSGFFVANSASAATIINVPVDQLTIQEAINAAFAGDTINVLPGTYTEDLTIDKQLTITGADKTTTAIKGVSNVPITSWPLAAPNIDIQADGVKVHGFTITGPDYEAGKYVSGMLINGTNVEIYDNNFVATAAETAGEIAHAVMTYSIGAIPTADVSGLSIYDNTFTGTGSVGLEAIYINPHTGSEIITINNNQISGSINIGITVESGNVVVSNNTINTTLDTESPPYGTYGIRFFDSTYSAANDNIVVSANNVQNFKRGIRIGNGGAGASVITASIESNTLTNNAVGIWARQYGAVVTATDNSISGNTIGIQNDDTTATVSAENNWWGAVSGPTHSTNGGGTGDAVSANVDYRPWFTDEARTVTRDYNVTIDVTGYESIQAAIDAAASDDTINVTVGTYAEDLDIDATKTGLELVGNDATIKGVAMTAAESFPLVAPNINVLADGVSIHGFTIQGPEVTPGFYSSGIVIGGSDVEIYDNDFEVTNTADETGGDIGQAIQMYNKLAIPGVDISGLSIHDNTFTSYGGGNVGFEGIYVNRDAGVGSISIVNNEFSGAIVRAITTERSNATISGNSLATTGGAWTGVLVMDVGSGEAIDSVAVINNTVVGFGNSIKIGDFAHMHVLTNVSVSGNSLDGVMLVRSSASGVVVVGNSLNAVTNTDSTTLDARNNYWGAASGPADGTITGNVDYRPWLLEEVAFDSEGNLTTETYDETITLTEADQWALVSAPTLLSETPAVVDDEAGTVALLVHDGAGFNAPTVSDADIVKPVSAFYVKTTNKGGIGFNYAVIGAPTNTSKQLNAGWNLVGTNNAGAVQNEFSSIQNTETAAGMVTLFVPDTYNSRKDMGYASWDVDANQDLNANPITALPGNNLSKYDGYWVFMNAAKAFVKNL